MEDSKQTKLSTEVRRGAGTEGEPGTDQEANCAADLLAIHVPYFHAVPVNRKQESHRELPLLGKTQLFFGVWCGGGRGVPRDQRRLDCVGSGKGGWAGDL